MVSARMAQRILENRLISILTPSRNRPQRLLTFINSVISLAHNPDNIEILVYIDNDDPAVPQYKNIQYDNVQFVYGDEPSISNSWNTLAEMCKGDVLIMGNDDLEYRTQDWDKLLLQELSVYHDDIYCAWMEDGINADRHCAFPIVSRLWYETLGYFTPGVFNFGYNDTWVYDIGKRVDRCHYIPHITAEHCHFSVNKASFDDTYARNRTQSRGNLYDLDKKIFADTENQRQADAVKLQKLIRNI